MMAKKCEICGRVGEVGSRISHAHNVSKRKFYVNLQRMRVKIGKEVKKVYVCTQCIKAGKVERPSY